ncbi:MAG: cell surface protein [Pseudomonadota bacterium]
MRMLAIVTIAAAALAVTACSREDRADIGEGAKAAGSEIKEAATDIANDPDVKEAGDAIGDAGKEAAGAVKEAAGDVQEGVADASADAKREADEASAAAGDTTTRK